ncbi:MAG: hypothetical protein GY757_21060 [bacterium]|nr:hypothetical protein [bacterium]
MARLPLILVGFLFLLGIINLTTRSVICKIKKQQ